MYDLNYKIIQSSFTGIVEVFASHPIEYMKTHIQCGKSMKTLKIYPKLYFNSMYPRFVTIIPMRSIFWTSYYYHKDIKSSLRWSSFSTSLLQTVFDYPSEQIKTKQMMNTKNKKLLYIECLKGKYPIIGFSSHFIRNHIFLYSYFGFKNNRDSFTNNLIGSLTGVFISHPFDTMKTLYQNETPEILYNYSKKDYTKQFKFLMRGVFLRALNTTNAMILGWFMFNYVYN